MAKEAIPQVINKFEGFVDTVYAIEYNLSASTRLDFDSADEAMTLLDREGQHRQIVRHLLTEPPSERRADRLLVALPGWSGDGHASFVYRCCHLEPDFFSLGDLTGHYAMGMPWHGSTVEDILVDLCDALGRKVRSLAEAEEFLRKLEGVVFFSHHIDERSWRRTPRRLLGDWIEYVVRRWPVQQQKQCLRGFICLDFGFRGGPLRQIVGRFRRFQRSARVLCGRASLNTRPKFVVAEDMELVDKHQVRDWARVVSKRFALKTFSLAVEQSSSRLFERERRLLEFDHIRSGLKSLLLDYLGPKVKFVQENK